MLVEQPSLGETFPQGNVTVLFTDIVGSTGRNAANGDANWIKVLRQHNEAVRREIHRAGGKEIKTIGDAFMVVFQSSLDAIECALGIQGSVAALDDGTGAPLQVRAGLHAGEPIQEGEDYQGTAVIVASRIASLALPGEILVSNVVKELAGDRGEVVFGESREVSVRGLEGRTYTVWPVIARGNYRT